MRRRRTDQDQAICYTLKQMRLDSGLSQKQLADLAGTQQSHISDIENGSLPSIPIIRALVEAMGGRISIKIEKWEMVKAYEI